MILTPHAIVGSTVANFFPSEPFVAFFAAFLSHYVLDFLPHKDYSINDFLHEETKTVRSIFHNTGAALHFLFIVMDFIFAVFLCFVFFVRNDATALMTLIGLVGGVLPDFFQFLYYKYKNQPWIFFQMVHEKVHAEKDDNYILGIVFQFVIPIVVLIFYYFIK